MYDPPSRLGDRYLTGALYELPHISLGGPHGHSLSSPPSRRGGRYLTEALYELPRVSLRAVRMVKAVSTPPSPGSAAGT